MKRLHISIFILFGWFFVFYNVERINERINLASFVYLLAPALGMLVLGFPWLRRVPLYWFVPVSIASVVALRLSFGYASNQDSLALVIAESLATWITISLSYQVGRGIDEYHAAAATAVFGHVAHRTLPFDEAQSDVVREVRRARQFGRQIAVVALNPHAAEDPDTLDRFTQEFRADLLRQYTSVKVAERLSDRLRPCDILTQTKDQFIALLPEMNRDDAMALAEEMRSELSRELGIDLQVGISMFPEDEVTVVGLIERAELEVELVRGAASTAFEERRVVGPVVERGKF